MITSDRRSARTRKTTIIVVFAALNTFLNAEIGLSKGRRGAAFSGVIRPAQAL
jgi:hypothetical protein